MMDDNGELFFYFKLLLLLLLHTKVLNFPSVISILRRKKKRKREKDLLGCIERTGWKEKKERHSQVGEQRPSSRIPIGVLFLIQNSIHHIIIFIYSTQVHRRGFHLSIPET